MNAKSCVEFVLQAMNNVDDECVILRIFLNGKLLLFGPEVFHSRELSIWGVLL